MTVPTKIVLTRLPRPSLFALLAFLAFSLLPISPLAAQEISREEVLKKYETAIGRAEELQVYQEDILHVVPKLQLAAQALMRKDFEQADRVLEEAFKDLSLIESQRGSHNKRTFRLEWLEIYWDIVQKYAVLALFAFFLVRVRYYRKMLKNDQLSVMARIYLGLILGFSAIIISLFDLSRFGESAWAFLDIQVVLLAICGLLGGLWSGLLAGILVGLFRWVLSPDALIYLVIALAAGLIGGLAARWVKSFHRMERASLAAGSLVAVFHGLIIYLPMATILPLFFVFISVLFLVVLETGAIFIFCAVVSGVLREEGRREMERELLKTKLLFLQAQISPHFLYNALNTISAICWRENAKQARELILHLAEFLRRTVRRADDMVTLQEEIAYIDSYLNIEKARFQERLEIEKQFDIAEESWKIKIPFLVLQPIVENAIKHGISKKEGGGTLKMEMFERNNHLNIHVHDDGVGINIRRMQDILAGKVKSEEIGIGVQNINQRMIRVYGDRYGLIFDSKEGKGTTVSIRFPLTEKKRQKKAGQQ